MVLAISAARKRLGITQKELAIRLNVSQGAISQWEIGTTNPSIELLPRLAEILGCTVDELLVKEKAPSDTEQEGGV